MRRLRKKPWRFALSPESLGGADLEAAHCRRCALWPSSGPSLSPSFLPKPERLGDSLYAFLEKSGNKPVRAIQRISAVNLGADDAALLELPEGSACLKIVRISYLRSGKVVEFTRSVYRGDAYDFVAELQIGNDPNGTRS